MDNVTSDLQTLYDYYMINNNSASTMFNALAGNSSDSGLTGLGALTSVGSAGALDFMGAAASLGGTSFSNILQSYLAKMQIDAGADSTEAATLADQLSSVLEEASESEDKDSLTYKTVQELYGYFMDKVSQKAEFLLKSTGSQLNQSNEESVSQDRTASQAASLSQMSQDAASGREFNFADIDAIVDSAFTEKMPMA